MHLRLYSVLVCGCVRYSNTYIFKFSNPSNFQVTMYFQILKSLLNINLSVELLVSNDFKVYTVLTFLLHNNYS